MNRRSPIATIVAAGFVLVLSACAAGARNTSPAVVYDFGLPMAKPVDEGWPGVALEVRSLPWSDSLGIDYRLAYDDPLKPREYLESRWAANPGYLLSQRLRQQLGTSVVSGGAVADCLLRVDLQEFSQVFDTRQSSRGVILADLLLVDGKRRRLAERRFSVEKSAATQDARGGVGALVVAADDLGGQIARWLAELSAGKGSPFCRSPAGVK